MVIINVEKFKIFIIETGLKNKFLYAKGVYRKFVIFTLNKICNRYLQSSVLKLSWQERNNAQLSLNINIALNSLYFVDFRSWFFYSLRNYSKRAKKKLYVWLFICQMIFEFYIIFNCLNLSPMHFWKHLVMSCNINVMNNN